MSEEITHYDVLGVEPAADKDAIRAAYQERLGEVRADIERAQGAKKPDESAVDGYRREEARVRSAWQVLSDPYQRGRYDATVEMGAAEDVGSVDGDGDGEVEPEAAAPTDRRAAAIARRRAAAANRPPGMFSTEPLPTPASWPPGVQPPPPRARVMAMLIDLVVLVILFQGLTVLGSVLIDDAYPKETTAIDHVKTCQDKLDAADTSKPKLATIKKAETYCATTAGVHLSSEAKLSKKKLGDRISDDKDHATTRQDNLTKKLQGASVAVSLGILLIALLYLIPSSVLTGRTLGKRLLHIRVVMLNGSRLTLRAALARYATPLLFAIVLPSLIPGVGLIFLMLALFGILTWPRNANLQGMHDRLAGTIVVDG